MSDTIEIVEAARRLDGSLVEWMRAVADAAAPLLGEGNGVSALAFRIVAGGIHFDAAEAAGQTQGLAQIALTTNREANAQALDRIYRSPTAAGSLSELFGPDSPDLRVVEATSGGRFRDTAGITAIARAGRGLALSSPLSAVRAMAPFERLRWTRIAAHLGAGLRLRDSLASNSLEDASVEAIFDASGRVHEARGQAKARSARDRLRAAVASAERSRGPLRRRDSDEALAAWEVLVAGRWSIVDHFERDGRRYLVAHRNPPEVADPRGLAPRERQTCELLGRGLAPKEIAYSLGIARSTVVNALASARRKLALRSSAELASFFAPEGLCAHFAEYELDGETLAVSSSALLDGERLAPLTEAEREIALLLVRGATNREIALQRGSAERTVANQIQSLFRKLGVASRAELAATALRSSQGSQAGA